LEAIVTLPWGWIIALSLSVAVATNAASLRWGYTLGRDAETARNLLAVQALEADLAGVTARANQAEADRLQIERERNDLLADLDAQGNAADGANRVVLPADSVSRINAIGR
jgi:hypothetical protein